MDDSFHDPFHPSFFVSVDQGPEPAKELLETLEKEMTVDQSGEAQRLAWEWKAKAK